MKRLLAVLTLAAVAALAPSGAHASSWPNTLTICNSVNSASWIWPHNDGQNWGTFGTQVEQGQCKTYANGSGQLRVYVPGDSYQFGQPNQGYGDCKNGPWDSNPPNVAKETYKAYNHDGC